MLLWPGSGSIVQVNGQRLAKPHFFNLQPLALSYLRTKKPLTKVGSVVYQINETDGVELSGIHRQNGSPGRCWGHIFAVSVKGDVLSFSVYIWGARNRQLNL